ncbi:hypothetical protein J3R83DRAFT_13205 [Lanmaoa asiatica]|nr:hypothetical protein J3R83DRAFT_13205 [Lanmaoa asiatica]
MSTSTASAPDTDTSSIPSLQDKKPPLPPSPHSRTTDLAPRTPTPGISTTSSLLILPSIIPQRSSSPPSSLPLKILSVVPLSRASSPIPHLTPATGPPRIPSLPPADPTHPLINQTPPHTTSLLPVDTQDQSAEKPQTRLNYNYSDPSAYPQSSLPSAPASTSQMSSFASPLTPDLRQQAPYVESDDWSNSPSAIARPSSTPGHPSLSAPLKYEDGLRHSSFSAPISQQQMFPTASRISGQQDRRPYPPGTQKSDEWSFPNQEFVLPPSNPSYHSASSPLSPPQPPPPSAVPPPSSPSSHPPQTVPSSTLVDRPTKKRGKLPKETTDYLKAWLHRHSDHPYPSEEEKKQLCHATGLSMSQVSNWMINVRHSSFLFRF